MCISVNYRGLVDKGDKGQGFNKYNTLQNNVNVQYSLSTYYLLFIV